LHSQVHFEQSANSRYGNNKEMGLGLPVVVDDFGHGVVVDTAITTTNI